MLQRPIWRLAAVTEEDRPPTVGERYARASVTSDLRVKDHPCDADKMLAAGYASIGDPRKQLALRLYRMRVTGDMASLSTIVADSDRALATRLHRNRGGNRPIAGRRWNATQRRELVTSTLRWWLNPTCGYCEGRCFELIDGAPAKSAEECSACRATGLTPLGRIVPGGLVQHAAWLAAEWDTLTALVLDDMAALLRHDLNSV